MRRALEISLVLFLGGFAMFWLWRTPLEWCAEFPVFVLLVVLHVMYPDWWKQPFYWLSDIIDYRRPDPAVERRKNGQCPRCGYELAGNLSGVCPECGAEIDFVPPLVRHHDRQ